MGLQRRPVNQSCDAKLIVASAMLVVERGANQRLERHEEWQRLVRGFRGALLQVALTAVAIRLAAVNNLGGATRLQPAEGDQRPLQDGARLVSQLQQSGIRLRLRLGRAGQVDTDESPKKVLAYLVAHPQSAPLHSLLAARTRVDEQHAVGLRHQHYLGAPLKPRFVNLLLG
jgi:hypothetical protein